MWLEGPVYICKIKYCFDAKINGGCLSNPISDQRVKRRVNGVRLEQDIGKGATGGMNLRKHVETARRLSSTAANQ